MVALRFPDDSCFNCPDHVCCASAMMLCRMVCWERRQSLPPRSSGDPVVAWSNNYFGGVSWWCNTNSELQKNQCIIVVLLRYWNNICTVSKIWVRLDPAQEIILIIIVQSDNIPRERKKIAQVVVIWAENAEHFRRQKLKPRSPWLTYHSNEPL